MAGRALIGISRAIGHCGRLEIDCIGVVLLGLAACLRYSERLATSQIGWWTGYLTGLEDRVGMKLFHQCGRELFVRV